MHYFNLRQMAPGLFITMAASMMMSQAWSETEEGTGADTGYVVHEWGNAQAKGPAACPDGRSLGYRQIFEQSPEGRRREGESDGDYSRRLEAGGYGLAVVDGKNLCAHPGLAPGTHFRSMDDTEVISYGIDLDGHHSTRGGTLAPGTCPHDDFVGVEGEQGVDNQYLRLSACTGKEPVDTGENHPGWLPPSGEAQENTMLEGGWGVLIALKGLDNMVNDDHVEVGIYANADPIVLGSSRQPIPYATYAADQDPRFRGETRGRIVDGVLITEPVDVRFHWLVAGFYMERPINRARIKARFNPDGSIEGYLAGYTPVEALYNYQYGFRNAKTRTGEPASTELMTRIATGAASAIGRTRNGAYATIYRLADGDPDPETGRCTSLSIQYFFRATPAFVVDVEARSVNDDT